MTTRTTEQSNNRRKPNRRKTDTSKLQVSLVAGSILATLVGGEMLANQDNIAQAEPMGSPVIAQQADGTNWTVNNDPIVELVIPEPVTKSRSSG